eukprot:2792146-Amphidinium_carterae.1
MERFKTRTQRINESGSKASAKRFSICGHVRSGHAASFWNYNSEHTHILYFEHILTEFGGALHLRALCFSTSGSALLQATATHTGSGTMQKAMLMRQSGLMIDEH